MIFPIRMVEELLYGTTRTTATASKSSCYYYFYYDMMLYATSLFLLFCLVKAVGFATKPLVAANHNGGEEEDYEDEEEDKGFVGVYDDDDDDDDQEEEEWLEYNDSGVDIDIDTTIHNGNDQGNDDNAIANVNVDAEDEWESNSSNDKMDEEDEYQAHGESDDDDKEEQHDAIRFDCGNPVIQSPMSASSSSYFGQQEPPPRKRRRVLLMASSNANVEVDEWQDNDNSGKMNDKDEEEEQQDDDKQERKRRKYNPSWSNKYKELQAYKEQHGDTLVPRKLAKYVSLAYWVTVQRGEYADGKMSPERTKLLDDLGFVWDTLQHKWNQWYQKLIDFKKFYGHLNVPSSGKEFRSLYGWVGRQRAQHLVGNLSKERSVALDSIGFAWENPVRSENPSSSSSCLVDHQESFPAKRRHVFLASSHVNANVEAEEQQKNSEKEGKIDDKDEEEEEITKEEWEDKDDNDEVQREEDEDEDNRYNDASDEEEEQQGDDKQGRKGRTQESKWSDQYKELQAFKIRYGHTLVPQKWPENLSLGPWAVRQRRYHANGSLSPERQKLMEDAGFELEPLHAKWNKLYQELKDFKECQGHCTVHSTGKEFKSLYLWSWRQRERRVLGKMFKERIAALDNIGFAWENPVRSKNPLSSSSCFIDHQEPPPAKRRRVLLASSHAQNNSEKN